MTTITTGGVDDQTAAVAAGFTDASLFDGRVYRDGVPVDPSAVTVTLSDDDSQVFTIGNLPEVVGSEQVVAITISRWRSVFYFPSGKDDFQAHRVITTQLANQTIASLKIRLFKGQDEVLGLLSVAQNAPGDDWVVSGFPADPEDDTGFWALRSEGGAPGNEVANTDQWQVGDVVPLPGGALAGRPFYSLDSDLLIFGERPGRLAELLQTGDDTQAAARVSDARCQADARINLEIGSCYDVPLFADLAGTWTVMAGSQGVVGTGTKALEELEGGQMIHLGGEDHAVLAVPDDSGFTLRDVHTVGVAAGIASSVPKIFNSLVRWWSYVLTLDQLLPGATAGSESLKSAVDKVEKSIAAVCSESLPLGDLVRIDSLAGFGFEPLPENLLPNPYGELRAQFQRGQLADARIC